MHLFGLSVVLVTPSVVLGCRAGASPCRYGETGSSALREVACSHTVYAHGHLSVWALGLGYLDGFEPVPVVASIHQCKGRQAKWHSLRPVIRQTDLTFLSLCR